MKLWTRITRDNNLRAQEIARATIKQAITSSLLTYRNHPEHQINEHTWMLRPIMNSKMREETKIIEKCSNQMRALVKVTTKETQSKM